MSEKKYELNLEEICRNYEEEWYPSFASKEGFNKEEFRFLLIPAAQADVLQWSQFCDEKQKETDTAFEARQFSVGLIVHVEMEGQFWLIRKMLRPPKRWEEVWAWEPAEGQKLEDDPLAQLPKELIEEMFKAARRKIRSNSVIAPEGTPADLAGAAPKS